MHKKKSIYREKPQRQKLSPTMGFTKRKGRRLDASSKRKRKHTRKKNQNKLLLLHQTLMQLLLHPPIQTQLLPQIPIHQLNQLEQIPHHPLHLNQQHPPAKKKPSAHPLLTPTKTKLITSKITNPAALPLPSNVPKYSNILLRNNGQPSPKTL